MNKVTFREFVSHLTKNPNTEKYKYYPKMGVIEIHLLPGDGDDSWVVRGVTSAYDNNLYYVKIMGI